MTMSQRDMHERTLWLAFTLAMIITVAAMQLNWRLG